MPKATEIAEIVVNGQRYRDWTAMSVTRNGGSFVTSTFAFSAASPIESGPNWSGLKLAIGDACKVNLAGQQVINGRITGRQPAYDAVNHGLQITGLSINSAIQRATVDRSKGEFKNYTLSQIANSVFQPFNIKFKLKGETEGADTPFERVNVQPGETVFALVERLCRMRNIYMHDDKNGDIIGYRLGATRTTADLQEGRNIKSASAVFNYEGAYSAIEAVGQRPGNDQRYGDAARDVTGSVTNSAVKQHLPHSLIAEMPGNPDEMRMRAQHENGENIATQVNVTIVVQGWHRDDKTLWLDLVGDVVSVYSPMIFTSDRMKMAIQDVTSSQSEAGTLTTLGLVLPERFNGGGQIDGGTPNIPGFTGA